MQSDNHSPEQAFERIAESFQPNMNAQLTCPAPRELSSQQMLGTDKVTLDRVPNGNNTRSLEEELAKWRERMGPFLADLAPKRESLRRSFPLETFDWRLETEADRQDFSGQTLKGVGVWEQITIPHYGAPIGKATTYYRTVFDLKAEMLASGSLFLCFRGVDYLADVFLNGRLLGSHEGFFAPFEFDVSTAAAAGKNTLVIRVRNDAVMLSNNAWGQPSQEGDKIYAATGPGWDDPLEGWQHCPPGMGIYQEVRVEARAEAYLSDIFVRTLPEEELCEAWVEVYNASDKERDLMLRYSVYGQNFESVVIKDAEHIPTVRNIPGVGDMPKPEDNKILPLRCGPGANVFKIAFSISEPRLWSPETPWLYQFQAELLEIPQASEPNPILDRAQRQFGMRSFRMEEEVEPKGRLYLNSKQIRLRGTNTMGNFQQDVMNKDRDQLIHDLLLAKICNLNYIRFTQRPVQEEIYDICDRLGLMTQCDLPLFGCLRRNQFEEALRQVAEMERLVRGHPCNVINSYINEPFPNASSQPHRHLDREELQAFFEAANLVTRRLNPDRVIKPVDGDYDPPSPGLPDNHCYNSWYGNHGIDLGRLHKGYWIPVKKGWHYACGEFGNEGLDPTDLMRHHYPPEWLPLEGEPEGEWTPAQIKGCQTGRFHYLWYEKPSCSTMEQWVTRSHEHQAWGLRLITEAFRRDSRMVSHCIHLFIDAFPASWMKVIIDFQRQPKPAFFAYRDACAPLNVHWRTDRFAYFSSETMPLEAWVCHDRDESLEDLILYYQLEMNGKVVHSGETEADVPACSSEFQGFWNVEAPHTDLRGECSARIGLKDAQGKVVAQSSREFVLFPALVGRENPSPKTCVLGEENGESARLIEKLDLEKNEPSSIESCDLLLIDSPSAYLAHEPKILAAVESGATAVLLQWTAITHKIAGNTIQIEQAGMGLRHFVSRDTDHPLVEGLERNDFKFLYDDLQDMVTPFLHTVICPAEGWVPILSTGSGDCFGNWVPYWAAAEKRIGEGRLILCQIELSNRLTNPAVAILVNNILKISNKITQPSAGNLTNTAI